VMMIFAFISRRRVAPVGQLRRHVEESAERTLEISSGASVALKQGRKLPGVRYRSRWFVTGDP